MIPGIVLLELRLAAPLCRYLATRAKRRGSLRIAASFRSSDEQALLRPGTLGARGMAPVMAAAEHEELQLRAAFSPKC
jgi:hypothetical protein